MKSDYCRRMVAVVVLRVSQLHCQVALERLSQIYKKVEWFFACSLKTFVGERPALDLMTAEEYGSIEKSLQQGKATAQTEAAAQPISKAPQPSENGDPSMEIDDEHPTENTEAPLGSSQPAEGLQQAVSASDITVSEEEVKAHWLSGVEALYEVRVLAQTL